MGSYVGSDYLAKLLLPESQIINSETVEEIKIKSHLGAAQNDSKQENDSDEIVSKITDTFEKIPYSGIPESSWSELDFIKDYISSSTTEQIEKKAVDPESQKRVKPESEYTYLDPENMDLDYEFGLCGDIANITGIYTVHICGFSVDSDSDLPFLKYLFELYGETFEFPHFDFTCPSNIGNPSSFISWMWNGMNPPKQEQQEEPVQQEENQGHVYFLNECLKRIITIIDVNDHSNPDILKTMYKGFLQDKNDKTQIYAFFDFGDASLEKTEFRRTWGLIDEIVNHKKLLGFGIYPKIIPLFDETKGLAIILDKEGHKVPIPYVIYLCKMEDGKYVNVYNEENTDNVYEERTMHPLFGRFYLFSLAPLDYQSVKSIFQIERYAVFTNDPIYFLKNTTDPLFLNPDFDDDMKGENNESIYFKGPDNVAYWFIKSSDDFTRL